MTRILILAAALALAGCSTLDDTPLGKGAFKTRPACTPDGNEATITSWWFQWVGITTRLEPEDTPFICGQQTRVNVTIVPDGAPPPKATTLPRAALPGPVAGASMAPVQPIAPIAPITLSR